MTETDDLLEIVLRIKSLLLEAAQNNQDDLSEYSALRSTWLKHPKLCSLMPKSVRECRTPTEYRKMMQAISGQWAPRRDFINREFNPVLDALESVSITPVATPQKESAMNLGLRGNLDEEAVEAAMFEILEFARNNGWQLDWFDGSLTSDGRIAVGKHRFGETDDESRIYLEAADRMLNETMWIRHDRGIEYKVTDAGRKALKSHGELDKMNTSATGVFIVHGHDTAARTEVENLLRKLHLEPIILADQTNRGATVIEKFERESNRAGFAVVLLTPDDVGCAKAQYRNQSIDELPQRARQNVVFELGFFFARLGRGNVAALQKGKVEQPSDVNGIVYISMEGNWKLELAKEMKDAGLNVDLNDL